MTFSKISFHPSPYRKLRGGWQHLFRCAILKLMPVGKLAEHFDEVIGRPTKELYSMAGLLFIMEFRDWTHDEAASAYMFYSDVQYALNLEPEHQSLCRRTIERYIKLFREDELASNIMHDVTAELVNLLELDVSKQRLDSTHVESNMAKFGRIKLMATAIRRFLTQVKRHDESSYNSLKESIRERYEASPNAVFGWKKLDDDGVSELRQSVAEDLAYLVEYYRRDSKHNDRSTYRMLVTVFEQQCEVIDDKVPVKKKTGGNIVCNPSDPDATFDGHKGSGYQVQLSETCSAENNVQLIIAAIPETACEHDSKAIPKLIEEFYDYGHQPDTLLADTAYGSDDNFQKCARDADYGPWDAPDHEATADPIIQLVSPTSGQTKKEKATATVADSAQDACDSEPALTILDFEYDAETNRFLSCPSSQPLHRAHYYKQDQHHLLMLETTCKACPMANRCPMRHDSMLCSLRVNGKDLRLAQRRAAERTDAFRKQYRVRGGIEATNAMLKRVTGLDRLRVRGRPAVFMSTLLKVAGWNLLRAASVRSLLKKLMKHGHAAQTGSSWKPCRRSRSRNLPSQAI